MIRKYKVACCPRCQFKYQSQVNEKLLTGDLQSIKCTYCKKIYYLITEKDGYICFTNFFEYHNYVEKQKENKF